MKGTEKSRGYITRSLPLAEALSHAPTLLEKHPLFLWVVKIPSLFHGLVFLRLQDQMQTAH